MKKSRNLPWWAWLLLILFPIPFTPWWAGIIFGAIFLVLLIALKAYYSE